MTFRMRVAVNCLALLLHGIYASCVHALPFIPAIPKGDISIQLNPIATGLGAPDYGFSPPGDTTRLFVVEQKGLLRIIENGSILPGSALDIQARVQQSTRWYRPHEPWKFHR